MLLKFCSFHLLLLVCASAASASGFCPRCKEEVWEEVPCEEIATTNSTTTTTARPIVPTYAPTTQKQHTTARPPVKKTASARAPTVYGTTTAPLTSTPVPSAYNNCYYECKGGCKEFCRKVTINGPSQKQITQITKTTHRVPNGQMSSEHVHQHRFVPDLHIPYAPITPLTKLSVPPAVYPIERVNERVNPYVHQNLAYKVQPALPPLPSSPVPIAYPQHSPNIYEYTKDGNAYPDALLETSYSVDELTRPLLMESLNKDVANSYTQPSIYGPSYDIGGSLPPTPLPSPLIYHSSSPIYGYSTPATTAEEPKHASISSISQYNPPSLHTRSQSFASSLLPSAQPQYANYVNKIGLSEPLLYGVASPPSPPSQRSNPQ